MQTAYDSFNSAWNSDVVAILVGAFVMMVSGALLCINVACQFSRTSAEKEMISRVNDNSFLGM
jgi:hypothetical protein